MEILGDKKFVEVPGSKTHELPPLLVRMTPTVRRLDRVMEMANQLIDQEEMLPFGHEAAQMDLAINLIDQYMGFVQHWQWGDSILEWIRQCETTFGARIDLRNLLKADLWPHAGRSSFVTLLEDKSVDTQGVGIEKAVGLRLTFRQPPPLKCFSDQFLLYLNSQVGNTAYRTWAGMTPNPVSALPPERFTFDVVNMSIQ
jgi:hypothetical protein